MANLTFNERVCITFFYIMAILAVIAPGALAGTESFNYQVNVSTIRCQVINGSLVDGSVFVETGGSSRTYNASQTQNTSFLGTLIANLTEESCPKQICTLNQTVNVNQTCTPVTVQPAVCPEDEDQPVCPTGTTCQAIPVIEIEEPEKKDNNGLYITAGILLIIGYFWYKKKYSGVKQNESQTEESKPRTERRDFKRPGG